MSATEHRCEDCGRRFVDASALFQHRKYKHKTPNVWDSLFELSVMIKAAEAQRKQMAGEPLEPWEEPYRH